MTIYAWLGPFRLKIHHTLVLFCSLLLVDVKILVSLKFCRSSRAHFSYRADLVINYQLEIAPVSNRILPRINPNQLWSLGRFAVQFSHPFLCLSLNLRSRTFVFCLLINGCSTRRLCQGKLGQALWLPLWLRYQLYLIAMHREWFFQICLPGWSHRSWTSHSLSWLIRILQDLV